MELLIPIVGGAVAARILYAPRRPAADPFFSTTILSSKNLRLISSNNYLPKLTSTARIATIYTRASALDSPTEVAPAAFDAASPNTRWMVVVEKPPTAEASCRAEIIDYYVRTLTRILPSEKEAQMCIYRASWEKEYFFCCYIDEDSSRLLASVPGVISVRPDEDMETAIMDSSAPKLLGKQSSHDTSTFRFSPPVGNCDYWLVKMEKPGVEVVTKAQMVDYFAQALTKVLGNEKDAQASIYNISWERDFGFCCQIDEECARELSDVPGVLSVQPDVNFDSENKKYRVDDVPLQTNKLHDPQNASSLPDVKTKRLFVTGLSFYTSEKTLRAAFEPFGELVEVKIIMDKISKRSKGYAFIEYTTEDAAGAALKEMNGKIINGWMIVVDVAKTNPPKYNRGHPRPPSSPSSSGY